MLVGACSPTRMYKEKKMQLGLEMYIKVWISARLGCGKLEDWANNIEIDNYFYWLDDQVLRIMQHAESLMIPAFLQDEDQLDYNDLYKELDAIYKREKAAELAAIRSGNPLELKVARKRSKPFEKGTYHTCKTIWGNYFVITKWGKNRPFNLVRAKYEKKSFYQRDTGMVGVQRSWKHLHQRMRAHVDKKANCSGWLGICD